MKKHIARAHKHLVRQTEHLPTLGVVLLAASLIFSLMMAYVDRTPPEVQVSLSHPTNAGGNLVTEELLEGLRNTTIVVPDQSVSVRLIGGVGAFSVAPNSSTQGVVMLLPGTVAYHDVAFSGDYVAAPIAVSAGGSGTFNYALLFVRDTAGGLQPFASAPLGDRVDVLSLTLDRPMISRDMELRVTIMTRPDDAAMGASRTVKKVLHFYYHNGTLVSTEEMEAAAKKGLRDDPPLM